MKSQKLILIGLIILGIGTFISFFSDYHFYIQILGIIFIIAGNYFRYINQNR